MKSDAQTPSLLQSIQWCADGELTAEEQAALFLELDEQASDEWRTLALALAEDRMVRNVLREADPAAALPLPGTGKRAPRPVWRAIGIAAAMVIACVAGFQLTPSPSYREAVSTHESNRPNHEAAVQPQYVENEIIRRAAELGYEAHLETALVTAQLPSGDSIVVPVSHLAMRETL